MHWYQFGYSRGRGRPGRGPVKVKKIRLRRCHQGQPGITRAVFGSLGVRCGRVLEAAGGGERGEGKKGGLGQRNGRVRLVGELNFQETG